MSILNSPIKVGRLTLKNRLVMSPMATPKSEDDGLVTEELYGYYSKKSQDCSQDFLHGSHPFLEFFDHATFYFPVFQTGK